MSESHLPRRNESYSGLDPEPGRSVPAQRNSGAGYADYASYQDRTPSNGGKKQVEQVLNLIFRRKWIILGVFLLVLAGTAVYTMTRVPQYQASSYVTVDLGQVSLDYGRRSTSGENPNDAVYSLFARSDRTLWGEIRLLEISDQLEQRVARRFREGTSTSLDSTVGTNEIGRNLAGRWRGRTSFLQERGTDNVIRMQSSSSDPQEAALLANLYAEEYVRLTQEASRTYVSALRKSLEEQERESRRELALAEEKVQRSIIERGGSGLDQDAERLVQQVTTMEMQLEDTQITLQAEEAALQSLEEKLKEVSPQLAQRIASDVERRLQNLQDQLATEEGNLAVILLENPELKERGGSVLRPYEEKIAQLREEILNLSEQYVQEVSAAGGVTGDGLSYVGGLRQQIAEKQVLVSGLRSKVEVLQGRLNEYERRMNSIPSHSMEMAQLQRTRLQAEQMYQSVSTKLQEARIAEESEPGYARMLRSAKPPRFPVHPDPQRNMVFGALLGLVLGLVLAVVRDKLDNHIYNPDQLREQGFKEIGIIPNMDPLIKEDYHGQQYLEQDGHRFASSLIALANPVAAATEAYRHVRTNIQFNLPDKSVQTLLVSSPGMREGKSTSAANLAIVMAQAGRRTLLIDADLRRPQQHRIFGLEREEGLIEVLAHTSDYKPEAWKTYVDDLYVLTAGRSSKYGANPPGSIQAKEDGQGRLSLVANPSELLGSEQMEHFLRAMRESFDVIIFDSPPVLAATDAAVLSTQCDATVVVARAGKTKEGELNYTLEAFADVGATIMGVLLNAFDINMAYGLKYRYQHYTRYGRYSKYGYYGVHDR